ncbi:molybdopterin-dependent oxidoreductase [Halioxenophilus aromaticivorans]|uniref:Molybdopterin oxidoreductase family protein n=1 Tax=Halioxenophilus aromaticivorans TaxID=1306992 RepID=A0AAV3U925_9ALTE
METTHYRACHICEAICGLEIKTNALGDIVAIKGDKNDPFSQGYICPKGTALQDIHQDPDRLRGPVKKVNGAWQSISWQQALDEVADKLVAIAEQHGNNAIGSYTGNPAVHSYGLLTHGQNFLSLFRSRNRFSATSVDQLPQQLTSLLMFGHQLLVPIPDIDRTQLMIIIGGNPMASNGSMMTVPNFRGRIKALQKRGGQLVVIDPRKSETAQIADQHLFVRPGSDAAMLLAMINIVLNKGWQNSQPLDAHLKNTAELAKLVAPFTPQAVAAITGIDEPTLREVTQKFAQEPKAVIYGRMGVSVQEFGTVCQWAIYLLNILTGKLDQPGGAMFTLPAWDNAAPGTRAGGFARWHSRVRQLPEFNGELPSCTMAEEITTPGDGQIKAMVTLAGNPVLSNAHGKALDAALDSLEFMVSIDYYINETTRHADIILPPSSPLERNHYDIAFNSFAVRNVARFNPAIFAKPEGAQHDWQISEALAEKIAQRLGREYQAKPTPEQMLDYSLQHGPYGAKNNHPQALSLASLQEHPNNLDLGALQSCLPERLSSEDKKIDCAPQVVIADLARVEQHLLGDKHLQSQQNNKQLKLISRRHVRSNNSWMHNYQRLVKGKDRSDLLIHPEDANARNLSSGDQVILKSRTGSIQVPVTVSEEIMPGVISLPHGYGHQRDGVSLTVAQTVAGQSINDITDNQLIDAVSGNTALNSVWVSVEKIA